LKLIRQNYRKKIDAAQVNTPDSDKRLKLGVGLARLTPFDVGYAGHYRLRIIEALVNLDVTAKLQSPFKLSAGPTTAPSDLTTEGKFARFV
jgi:hypothetical protein